MVLLACFILAVPGHPEIVNCTYCYDGTAMQLSFSIDCWGLAECGPGDLFSYLGNYVASWANCDYPIDAEGSVNSQQCGVALCGMAYAAHNGWSIVSGGSADCDGNSNYYRYGYSGCYDVS